MIKSMYPLDIKQKLFTDFYVFDTETQGLRAKSDAFIFGVIYSHNFVKVIYSVKEFQKEFQKEQYKKKKVFCHNAEYDLNVIYDNIYELDKKAIFNGKFICCSNGNCTFADSVNILPASVREIGKISGLEKLETSEDFIKGTYKGNIKQKDIDYCVRDCEIVYNALYHFFELVGSIKITTAGLSLDYFRRYFLKEKIEYNPELCKYFFNSYFGGRTEAFFIGKIKGYCFDINSMYPFAMLNVKFPNPKTLKKIPFCDVNLFINKYLKLYEGVAKIKIKHNDSFFGFLPYKKDGKLLFPIGEFTGWYNFNEIRFALENNIISIINVSEVVYAESFESPFKDFVNTIYNRRKHSSNELEKTILKLLMNSLYGKFAQKAKSEMVYINDIEKELSVIEDYEKKNMLLKIIPFNSERNDCFIEVKSNKGFLYNTIPVFSSYITSFARIELLKYLIAYQKFNPIYCDTDSIFFSESPNITESSDLGKWKKEEKIITGIYGLKNYTYIDKGEHKRKIKGIPKLAQKIDENIYQYETLIKTREALMRNRTSGVLEKRTKILSLKYDKRIVNKNGTTKPIKL